MEEKFGKSAKVLYIVSYAIIIAVSLLFVVGLGVAILVLADADMQFMGWSLVAFGAILAGVSIFWLVYFIRMPLYTVTYKDGKLNFRNKVECTPLELEKFEHKGNWGLDGSIFNFGRIFIYVNGKRYKFNFIYNAESVVQRLYTIKVEYIVQQNIAKQKAEAAAEPVAENVETENKVAETEEKNG